HPVAKAVPEEKRVVDEVAFEEPAGFRGDAVGPFHADLLEKGRRLGNFAGVEGKGGTDAEVHPGRKPVLVAGDPVLLLRAAETDPDQVGAGLANLAADAVELVVRPLAEGR